MKVAVLGGGGARCPLLIRGLAGSDLPLERIACYDTDPVRLALMDKVARCLADPVRLALCDTPESCIDGADFVFASIRVGGMASRIHDERVALDEGVVGQETVGAAGFAMAMRNVPHVVRYARRVEQLAPEAWIINFTNPVGIITQAVQTETSAKIIGICDTPTELLESAARVLDLPAAECRFDFFGLNHLGWLREVHHGGRPELHRLWSDAGALQRIYRAPLFEPERLASLRLLPTEYVYFYEHPRETVENLRRAGRTRGEVIQPLNDGLHRDLESSTRDPVATYEAYLEARDAGYMMLESGGVPVPVPVPRERPHVETLSGYDRIALAVLRALARDSGAVIAVDVRNDGTLGELEDEDVIEVPCTIDARGARPMPVAPVPAAVSGLIHRVKEYERLSVQAALSPNAATAIRTLACHPLVDDYALAARLIERLHLE